MNPLDDTAGRASVPCRACGLLLDAAGRCACGRQYEPSRAPDEAGEAVALSQMPGATRRRGRMEDA